jgi:hypothetical protein
LRLLTAQETGKVAGHPTLTTLDRASAVAEPPGAGANEKGRLGEMAEAFRELK